jgi:YVTN family beta-propeller protein
MRRSRPNGRSRHGRRAAFLLAATSGLLAAILPPVAATSFAATASAPSPGYTASEIPVSGAVASSTIAVNSATNTIYMGGSNVLRVINGTTGALTATIPMAGLVEGIGVDATTNRVYVSVAVGPAVTVIDGSTNAVLTSIPVVGSPQGIAVDSATNTVYVATSTAATVTVINGATNTVTTTVSTGLGTRPVGVAVDEATNVIWVADAFGSLIDINGSTNSIIGGLGIGGGEITSVAVNANTDTVYATDFRSGNVVVVNGLTNTLSSLIPVGIDVDGIAVDQSSGVVYATSYVPVTGITWIIDGSTNHVTDTIGRGGFTVAVNQSTGAIDEPSYRFAGIWVLTASASNAWSPIITSTPTVVITTGFAANVTLFASALPAATFAETGTMPAGITLSTNGILSGTAAADAGGVYPITITASNGVAPDYAQQMSLIVDQPPVITGAATATFEVGTAASYQATATGYPPPSFSASGAVPTGIAVTYLPGSFQLSGTPAVGSGGVYPIALSAWNGVATMAQQSLTLTVNEAPSFFGSAQATLTTGQAANVAVTAHGYPAPTFSETGTLPTGVMLSSAGTLTGTPAAGSGGTYPITITATNGIGTAASEAFTITVDQPPAFTSASHVAFGTGRSHTFTFRTSGFPAATLSERGALPSGVTFKAGPNGTAVLVGRPPRADIGKVYVITVTARNGVGAAVTQRFRLTVI